MKASGLSIVCMLVSLYFSIKNILLHIIVVGQPHLGGILC